MVELAKLTGHFPDLDDLIYHTSVIYHPNFLNSTNSRTFFVNFL